MHSYFRTHNLAQKFESFLKLTDTEVQIQLTEFALTDTKVQIQLTEDVFTDSEVQFQISRPKSNFCWFQASKQ
jgi:hypothetical protein